MSTENHIRYVYHVKIRSFHGIACGYDIIHIHADDMRIHESGRWVDFVLVSQGCWTRVAGYPTDHICITSIESL